MKKTMILMLFVMLLSSSSFAQEMDRSIVVGNKNKSSLFSQNGHHLNIRDIKFLTSQDPEAYYLAKVANRRNVTAKIVSISGVLNNNT